jgi:hypothetical protein
VCCAGYDADAHPGRRWPAASSRPSAPSPPTSTRYRARAPLVPVEFSARNHGCTKGSLTPSSRDKVRAKGYALAAGESWPQCSVSHSTRQVRPPSPALYMSSGHGCPGHNRISNLVWNNACTKDSLTPSSAQWYEVGLSPHGLPTLRIMTQVPRPPHSIHPPTHPSIHPSPTPTPPPTHPSAPLTPGLPETELGAGGGRAAAVRAAAAESWPGLRNKLNRGVVTVCYRR